MVPGKADYAILISNMMLHSGHAVLRTILCLMGIAAAIQVPAGVQLNEVLARNAGSAVDSQGRSPDFVELINTEAVDVSLSGFRMSVSGADPSQWAFPSGAKIAAGGFLTVWCDDTRRASSILETDLNIGRSLGKNSGGIFLYDAASNLLDSVSYGFQIVDLSFGRSSGQWRLLASPTPGAVNAQPVSLGNPVDLRINEWLAIASTGSDWFELFNKSTQPTEISGLLLVDDPTGKQTVFTIPALCFIGGNDWVQFDADKATNSGPNHVSFGLSAKGGTLALWTAGRQMIDQVGFGVQTVDVSEGRLPDGGTNIVRFPQTPTPGADNYLPLTHILINEMLAHTDPPLEDAVELYNPNATNVDVGGWFLANKASNLKRYRIPDNTVIPAGGYYVLYEYEFTGTDHFTFNSAHGDKVYLSTGDQGGSLTGYRASQSFGPSFNGVSFGRYLTSVGVDFVPMSRRTFGHDTPISLEDFRQGGGATNATPIVEPVVINEIMYHPPDLGGTNAIDNVGDEFIELYNYSAYTISLYDGLHPGNTWKVGGDVSFVFPIQKSIPAWGYLILVSFDPVNAPGALASFKTRYTLDPRVQVFGPYSGKLSNSSGAVELYRPDNPQLPPHPDAGFVPYVMIERIQYGDSAPWPVEADGGGASLQRKSPTDYGNDPVNWRAGTPTPGIANEINFVDSDGDGMPDVWETAFGLNPHDPGDAIQDADGDGMNNSQEYLAGTDPTDAKSVLRLSATRVIGGGVLLRFKVVPGRSYSLEYWETGVNGWQRFKDFTAGPDIKTAEMTDSTVGNMRWFRVRTPQLP
jgi:hypothetical protein